MAITKLIDTTTNDDMARLDAYARRLHDSVVQATILHATFRSLNESKEWQASLVGSIVNSAYTIQHALLREPILILVRVHDKPSNLETTDKVSFFVVGHWLQKAGVQEALVARARRSSGKKWADRNAQTARDAILRAKERLERLANETPNREKLLRNFRNGFLAHELHIAIPKELPLFGHIKEMTEEIQGLCIDVTLAVNGDLEEFDCITESAKDGADQIWRAVAAREK